jgi:adenine deaminase
MVKKLKGNVIDIVHREIFPAEIQINEFGKISRILKLSENFSNYFLPGFIDSHIHIESSMLPPLEFSRIAVKHGTVSVVCDPHEIANVLGIEGINYMIENAEKSELKFNFGIPSCVPATSLETSGATIDSQKVAKLISTDKFCCLSEMMNYPGVIYNDEEVLKKINSAIKAKLPIDGHAPFLIGKDLEKYIRAGISTDHEASTYEEGKEKIEKGMKILIREGSAAKNFEKLIPLMKNYPDKLMFCSDDKHPDDLSKGHINLLVKRALGKGYDLFDVLRAATLNPIKHYKLNVGMLQIGDSADFIEVKNLSDFNILKTFINGKLVYNQNEDLNKYIPSKIINNFSRKQLEISELKHEIKTENLRIIKVIDGELTTESETIKSNLSLPNIEKDILKIVVVNRYSNTKPAVAFVKGFGLKHGAIASSVAHDSHNIIAVGTNDEDILVAINSIIKTKGGLVGINKNSKISLDLPIAGLISNRNYEYVSSKYFELNSFAKSLGTTLTSPFMTLSFMALIVIPHLKISDKGLFDVDRFSFI